MALGIQARQDDGACGGQHELGSGSRAVMHVDTQTASASASWGPAAAGPGSRACVSHPKLRIPDAHLHRRRTWDHLPTRREMAQCGLSTAALTISTNARQAC